MPNIENDKQSLRQLTDDELKDILKEHAAWLETENRQDRLGKQADLSNLNLEGIDLRNQILTKAKFEKTILRGADLGGITLDEASLVEAEMEKAFLFQASLQRTFLFNANLQHAVFERANMKQVMLLGADLQHANLRYAELENSDLTGSNVADADFGKANLKNATLTNIQNLNKANLHDCNLDDATGLKGTEFAGADITGANLPDDIEEFKTLEIVEETSKNARKIFLAVLLACVYSWLTIGSTDDVALLTNSASSPLPIIRTAIPIASFFLVAPILLLGFYFYLHFYLQRLWENLASLPAIFEDGKRLDQRAYPWLLNGLVRRNFEKLKTERTLINRFEEWVSIFLAWWVVPITLFCFWLRYIPRHHWPGTYLHIFLIILAVAIGNIFYRAHVRTLQGDKNQKPTKQLKRFYQPVAVTLLACMLLVLSYGAINGNRFYEYPADSSLRPEYSFLKSEVPGFFRWFSYNVFADFNEKDVSIMPDNYWQLSSEDQIRATIGANLKNADLRYSNAGRAFLVNADLRETNLHNAYLYRAKLQGADLSNANLRGANLMFANLHLADLSNANLQKTNLSYAHFYRANLDGAKLQGADLSDVKGLEQYHLDQACGDSTTILPKLPSGLTIKPCPE